MLGANKYCEDCDESHALDKFCGECGNCIYGNCECLRCDDCKSIEITCDCKERCSNCENLRPKLSICFDHGVCESCCSRSHFPDDPDNQ